MRQTGFTLIELLIAMTILLMVTYVGTYSYGLYSQYWQKEQGEFSQTFEEAKNVSILFSAVKNLKPLILTDEADRPYHYFEGGKSLIRSVTNNGISDPRGPAVFELKVEETNRVKSLVYSEASLLGGIVSREADFSEKTYQITLLSGFDDLSFEFWGWPDFDVWLEESYLNTRSSAQWYGYYSGKDTMIPPEMVKVTLSYDGQLSSLIIPLPDFSDQRLSGYFSED